MVCHKVAVQRPMHRFLIKLLNELKFKCNDCARVMPYEKLKGHKGRGECQKGLDVEEEEGNVAAEFQPNAQQNVELIKSLFILERDSKFVHEYVLQTKTLLKHSVSYHSNFPHNFQSVQTPTGRLFLIGGGDFNKMPDSLFECYEIMVQD